MAIKATIHLSDDDVQVLHDLVSQELDRMHDDFAGYKLVDVGRYDQVSRIERKLIAAVQAGDVEVSNCTCLEGR